MALKKLHIIFSVNNGEKPRSAMIQLIPAYNKSVTYCLPLHYTALRVMPVSVAECCYIVSLTA